MANTLVRTGWMTGAALILALTLPVLHGQSVQAPRIKIDCNRNLPRGQVLEPRLGVVAMPADRNQIITFKGWVDKCGVKVQILVQGNSGLPNDLGVPDYWVVADVYPSRQGTVVDGQWRYDWEFTALASAIFRGQDYFGTDWPDGGTTRVRVRAQVTYSVYDEYLPIRDNNGVIGRAVDLVLADNHPRPTDLPASASPNYLNRKQTLSEEETGRYYLSVGTGPDGGGVPILSALFTLESFKRRYFDSAASCGASSPEYVTQYFNKGDLGLGREMHCVRNGCTEETACYVKNYGDADGTPLFDDFFRSRAALLADKPFATVAMVERGSMSVGAANKVFFVVYDHQRLLDPANPDSATIAFEAPLDTKGYNKSIPTNCLACHGPGARYTESSSSDFPFNASVTGAYFLPFDLESFHFFSFNTRRPQEAAFRGLNELVYFTDLWFNRHANELLDGWYGGPAWPSATFRGRFIPDGWRNSSNPRDDANRQQLYRYVVAPYCRTCHISHADATDPIQAGQLTFGTYDQLFMNRVFAYEDVCRTHAMPNAEQALKYFWPSPARSHFLNRLDLPLGACAVRPQDPPSSALREVFSLEALEHVERFALESCACTTPDCLTKLDDQYLRELADTRPRVRGSEAAIALMLDSASECRRRVLKPDGAGGAAAHVTIVDRLLEREMERFGRRLRTP